MATTRNPRSGSTADVASGSTAGAGHGTPPMCSDETREPLPGTAKTGGLVLALEHSRGWGRDILDGEALGKDLTGRIRRYLKDNRAQLQFIRRPGRVGQEDRGSVTLYIADATAQPPTLERMDLSGPEALLQVDLSTPGAVPGAVRVDHPLLLVCTHGKRDRCCAVKGRPLAGGLHRTYPDVVWESSHTKGHRFAPSMILLPWNYSFGTLDLCGADDMLAEVLAGRLPVAGNRGRGTLDARGQVAELAVAAVLAEAGEPVAPGELQVTEYHGPLPGPEDVTEDAAEDVTEDAVEAGTEAPAADGADATPGAPALTADAPDPAEVYAAVAAMVPDDLRRRAGELLTQRTEMKITGRYAELKALTRQGHFRPVEDYEQAVKAAAVAHGVYGKYSRFGKYSAWAAEQTGQDGRSGSHHGHDHHRDRRRPEKRRKDAPVLLVTRPGDPATGTPARRWTVGLESQRCYPVVSSCGDRPKEGRSWVATGVTEITG